MQTQEEVERICYQNELDRAEAHENEVEPVEERDYPKTRELRRMLDHIGMEHTDGYVMDDGSIEDAEKVTCVWPVHDEPCASITFEEEDGELFIVDTQMTPYMAVQLAIAAMLDWERSRTEDGKRQD